MLSRALSRPLRLQLRSLSLAFTAVAAPPSSPPLPIPHSPFPLPRSNPFPRPFSTNRRIGRAGDGDGPWKPAPEDEVGEGRLFWSDDDEVSGDVPLAVAGEEDDGISGWTAEGEKEEGRGGIFEEIDKEIGVGGGGEWETAKGFKPWGFEEEEGDKGKLFESGDEAVGQGELEGLGGVEEENRRAEELAKLDMKEKELKAVLKGPDRAFGDLIAASGITDEMLDSLILLKDVSGIKGLPPLEEIEDNYAEKGDDTTRFEEERKKQQEITKARVKQVDEQGRAYGTGRRKCSVARVFIQPGDGKFIINDKQFDIYFPCLDHRAELLSPFMVTNTVGRWDVKCTVKGGGLSGQVGAIRLGISKALQNWEPGFRDYLRPEGFLTRDPRVVERKKPGKAKARKSFQWVKR